MDKTYKICLTAPLLTVIVHRPAGGLNDWDRTSYLPAQREWYCTGPHHWHPSQDAVLYRFQRGDLPYRTDPVGPLRWRGNIVLSNESV